jgi:hypothetical protein
VTLTTAYQANVKTCHGRTERREMWVLADAEVAAYAGSAGTVGDPWPHLQQLCWRRRERTVKGVTSVETGYAITSAVAGKADATRLLRLSREYWGIENQLHWVRDVTYGEDDSQVRSGAAPQVCAALRNLAIALLRRSGVENVAAALRTHSARPRAALALVLAPFME